MIEGMIERFHFSDRTGATDCTYIYLPIRLYGTWGGSTGAVVVYRLRLGKLLIRLEVQAPAPSHKLPLSCA